MELGVMEAADPYEDEPDRSSEKVSRIPVAKWLEALEEQVPILTFNKQLDEILNGGVHLGYITEIFGGKASGKTTLCIQLCITVQLPRMIKGLESEAIFIDTEQTFVVSRVKEMIRGCVNRVRLIPGNTLTTESLLNGIQVIQCCSVDELRKIVLDLDSYLLSHPKVKLVVLDSIAFLFYVDPAYSRTTGVTRNKILYYFAQEFNRLINKYGIAVVVTNNVTTRFSDTGTNSEIPYLGPSWPYISQVRLELLWEDDCRQAVLHKTFSRFPQTHKAPFQIRTPGIR